jgi:AAA+ ATPase superfamily predicted ATPase
MHKIIARTKEIEMLDKYYKSKEPAFIALYGRRRVGKTFLIRSLFSIQQNYFEITGLKGSKQSDQLRNFTEALSRKFFKGLSILPPSNWHDAFNLLTTELELIPKSEKIVLFFDELPWLASKKSQFLTHLDYIWNTRWSQMPNVMLIVCGSAASWMMEKLISAKGGLHNRLTKTILLEPFTLNETEKFLHSRSIRMTRRQIFELYMAIGGVPHYLNSVEKGKSAAENIGNICFEKDGLLYDEFPKLFRSLFDEAEINLRIIKLIAESRYGISRTNLLKAAEMKTGGTFNKRIEELEAAGFIQSFVPYGKKNKDHYYRVIDEYSLFYLKWIEPAVKLGHKIDSATYWINKTLTSSYQSWAGYTFEGICIKHAILIKKAIGLNKIACETGSWRFVPAQKSNEQGAQIDLLFDREDGVINLCEIKYASEEFKLDKAYAKTLLNKVETFEKHFKTKKQIFITLITTFGAKESIWTQELVANEVTMDAFFES